MERSYNAVAWFYDRLSRLLLGRAPLNAQLYLLGAIPANSNLLIIGGGTGWILESLAALHPSGLTITYIDASSKMVAIAQRRKTGANKITFITEYVERARLDGVYDVVLTPFLFDNFKEDSLDKIFAHIDSHSGAVTRWLWCDFRSTDSVWQKAVLATMYLFFRAFCAIEATHLPHIEACFRRHGYRAVENKTFMNGFIIAGVYKWDSSHVKE
jgi:hypothetical protein